MKIHVCREIDKDKFHGFDPDRKNHYNLELVETINRKPFHKGYVFGGIDYAYMHDIDRNGLYIIEGRW